MKVSARTQKALFLSIAICTLAPCPVHAQGQEPCRSNETDAPLPESLYSEILEIANTSLLPTVGQAEKGDSPKEFETCLNTQKKEIAQRKIFAVPSDLTLRSGIEQMNRAIQMGSEVDSEFSLKSDHPPQVEKLALEKEFQITRPGPNNQILDVSYKLFYGKAEGKDLVLGMEASSELYQDGKLIRTYSQNSYFDESCIQHDMSYDNTNFAYQGEQVTLTRKYLSDDGRGASEVRVISKSLLDESAKLNELSKVKSPDQFPKRLEGHLFGDFNVSNLKYQFERLDSEKLKKNTENQPQNLIAYRTLIQQGDDTIARSIAVYSSGTDRAVTKTTTLAAPDQSEFEETTSEEAWNKSKLVKVSPTQSQESDFVSDSLSVSDVLASRMALSLTMNQDESFNNRPAYGLWTQTQAENGKYQYRLEYGSEKSLPVLKSGNVERYLRETSYYDFTTPEVQQLIAKALAKKPQTPQEKVLAILDVVNQTLQPDYQMIAVNSVRPVKASVTVKIGKGVCQHYAGLFVAMARAMGVPSRSVEGLAFFPDDKNPNEYRPGWHAWVEVSLDGKSWTPLEPQVAGQMKLPRNRYIPLKEMTTYENSINGSDVNLRDTREMQGYKVTIKKLGAN